MKPENPMNEDGSNLEHAVALSKSVQDERRLAEMDVQFMISERFIVAENVEISTRDPRADESNALSSGQSVSSTAAVVAASTTSRSAGGSSMPAAFSIRACVYMLLS
jgi:hypothetical protein